MESDRYAGLINYESYNLILLRKELAYHYMNSGLLDNVVLARGLLDSAISSFEIGGFSAKEQLSTYFQLKLLRALSHEFYFEHNKAYSLYEAGVHDFETSYRFIDAETKNVFYRLMYIIEPDAKLKKKLLDYEGHNLVSIYQNDRRIVERAIYDGCVTYGDIVKLSESFERIKHTLDKLYHVTHYRLMYQYFLRRGEHQIADQYYRQAINIAENYEFFGQIDRIKIIRENDARKCFPIK